MTKIKVLHIVGGSFSNGAFKGANILHRALLDLNIDSKILNDSPVKTIQNGLKIKDKNIISINISIYIRFFNKVFIFIEKIIKTIFLDSPRSTFTIGFFGFDVTKLKEYKDADIIHIHWLNQGFIKIKSLSKIDKPVIWTMRDMWPFTGGSHYTMDFEKYENSRLSKILKNYKKKNYNKNFRFIAISEWLKDKAANSKTLSNFNIKRIYNNINLGDFDFIKQEEAQSIINIETKKKIIVYGAQNPQSKRKGWNIFIKTLAELDKSKYFLLIFGNFWSQKTLDDIGIEYKSVGFVNNNRLLNAIYCSGDCFVASSIQEAFGKTWAEAMACQTPIICFDKTPASEIIDHKVNGYIVKNFSSNELKDGIEWICEEIEKKNYQRNASRNKVMEFDSKFIAKKYIDLYKKILSNH